MGLFKDRNSWLVVGLIAAVALPATLSVTAYMITKNPTLRPLARTKNDEARYYGTFDGVEIIAQIRWPDGRRKSFSQQELSKVIRQAFIIHGVEARVVFETVKSAEPVTITYQVGANTFGPQTVSNAADSIRGAVAVYRMYRMTTPGQ